MFARLFAINSTFNSSASMPIAAMLIARMIQAPLSIRHGAEFLDRLFEQVFARFREVRAHLVSAQDFDHVGDLDHGLDVGPLHEALVHTRRGGCLRTLRASVVK